MNVRDRYREEFRAEARERVERLLQLFNGHALSKSELTDLRREIHGIKGTAGMFGDPPIAALALALENVFAVAAERGSISAETTSIVKSGLERLLERCHGTEGDDQPLITDLAGV